MAASIGWPNRPACEILPMAEALLDSMRVLFLDFDGVLHPDPPSNELPLFCRAKLLEEWLVQHPDVCVVISSTWRLKRSLEQLKDYFPTWQHRIVGMTPDIPLDSFQRQVECEAWMRAHAAPWTPWAALDDRLWNFRPFEKRLILVDRKTGLTPNDHVRLTRAVYG
jgi:hypothetical protein